MKKSKVIMSFMAFVMILALAGCGGSAAQTSQTSAAAETEQTSAAEAEEETTEAQAEGIAAGTFRFDYTDPYGDITTFTVTTKDNGSFNILTTGAMGNGIYSGTEWTDNGDGTITTGATDTVPDVEWLDSDDGTATWTVDGTDITPVNYTEPTEFIEKSEVRDPETAAECVGVYTFGDYNAEHASTTPWVVWVNADGTYRYWRDNAFLGLRGFSGTWTYAGDGVVDFSPAVFDEADKEPVGDFLTDDYACSWKLYGDGTCEPVGREGSGVEVDTASLSDPSIYPEGCEYVGVYVFGDYNAEHASTTPWVVWVNADGTYRYWRDNAFLGLRGFSGTWNYVGDGTFDFSAPVFDEADKEPVGDFFKTDDYQSTWIFSLDGTCVPEGYTGTAADVDLSTISDQSIILGE